MKQRCLNSYNNIHYLPDLLFWIGCRYFKPEMGTEQWTRDEKQMIVTDINRSVVYSLDTSPLPVAVSFPLAPALVAKERLSQRQAVPKVL